jgi:Tfp pilus assembly protein PilN
MSLQGPGSLYTDVNLLPSWYAQAGNRRSAARRQMGLIVLMVAGMGMLLVQTYHRRSQLVVYRDTLIEQVNSTQKQITEVQKLEKARAELLKNLKIHRELYQPISYSQVAGTLGSLVPETVALRTVQMHNEKVTTTRPMTQAEVAAEMARAGKVEKNTVTVTQPVITIDVEGIAPSDVEVANFIGALAGSRVFQNVKMLYAKQGSSKIETGTLITRDFKIHMEVPLDCDYRQAGEVARAH